MASQTIITMQQTKHLLFTTIVLRLLPQMQTWYTLRYFNKTIHLITQSTGQIIRQLTQKTPIKWFTPVFLWKVIHFSTNHLKINFIVRAAKAQAYVSSANPLNCNKIQFTSCRCNKKLTVRNKAKQLCQKMLLQVVSKSNKIMI